MFMSVTCSFITILNWGLLFQLDNGCFISRLNVDVEGFFFSFLNIASTSARVMKAVDSSSCSHVSNPTINDQWLALSRRWLFNYFACELSKNYSICCCVYCIVAKVGRSYYKMSHQMLGGLLVAESLSFNIFNTGYTLLLVLLCFQLKESPIVSGVNFTMQMFFCEWIGQDKYIPQASNSL